MLPCFLCLLQTACTVFLPESPRWLVSIGDVQRATSILQAAATTNGRSLPPGRFCSVYALLSFLSLTSSVGHAAVVNRALL